MDAFYTMVSRPDPDDAKKTYIDHTLHKDTQYCCGQFQSFCKKFPSWDYTSGKFTIVDQISYEASTQTPIHYCPFCGQKIKYKLKH